VRREKTVVITTDNRDRGKTFVLTEMPAERAEDWFVRAVMLLARSGTDVPPDIFNHGPQAFAAMGIGAALTGLGKAPWQEVKPLLDEMFTCVAFQPPGANLPLITAPQLVNSQIEEVRTRFVLREEVLSLHLGFSLAAELSRLRALAVAATTGSTPTTPTSDDGSGP
jgi:hypothetical protein